MPSQQQHQQKLLIGTGIDKIYSASFCSETGRITVDNEKCHIASGKGPTWLLPTSNKLRLYAVNEHEDKIQVFDRTTTEDDDGCTPSCCWRKSSNFLQEVKPLVISSLFLARKKKRLYAPTTTRI